MKLHAIPHPSCLRQATFPPGEGLAAPYKKVMQIRNKKINFLGDSITEGCCATDNRGFVDILARDYGVIARNYGIGGTRIARQRIPSAEPQYDRDFCGRFREMDRDADVIFVFGGTNDHGHGDAPVGRDTDRTPDTFLGACHYLFAGLQEMFPRSKIIVATPLHRMEEGRADGIWLKDYVNHIRTVAEDCGLPVLDLYETSAINPATLSRLTTDGLHPNDEGHRILAEEIAAFLQSL
jgi:lysophospholipase L1-like esterase